MTLLEESLCANDYRFDFALQTETADFNTEKIIQNVFDWGTNNARAQQIQVQDGKSKYCANVSKVVANCHPKLSNLLELLWLARQVNTQIVGCHHRNANGFFCFCLSRSILWKHRSPKIAYKNCKHSQINTNNKTCHLISERVATMCFAFGFTPGQLLSKIRFKFHFVRYFFRI